MPRPKQGYTLDGEPVPGVTTITGALDWGKSGRLMGWAVKETKAGRDYNKSRDRAADAGTVAHALIEAHLLKQMFPEKPALPELEGIPEDVVTKGETAYLNFLTWAEAYQLEPISVEEPLVSRKWRVGTTPDLIARVKGKISMIDYKTGGAYETSFIELAARKEIWEELHPEPEMRILGGFHLLQFDRENGAFTHSYRESLPGCFEAFLCLRELYDLKKTVMKVMK